MARGGYLRFLYRLYPFMSHTYSKPVSMSCLASLRSLVALHVHSSLCVLNSAWSRFM